MVEFRLVKIAVQGVLGLRIINLLAVELHEDIIKSCSLRKFTLFLTHGRQLRFPELSIKVAQVRVLI